MGAERAGLGSVVDDLAAQDDRVVPRRLDADIIPPLSDHYAFEQVGIPFLFYSSGRDRNYHTPQDTPEKLDYPKMVGLADHLTDLVCSLAEGPAPIYDAEGIDDATNLRTLIDVGRHAGPLHPDADRVMILIDKLERKLEAGTPLTRFDRGSLQATILAIEHAIA